MKQLYDVYHFSYMYATYTFPLPFTNFNTREWCPNRKILVSRPTCINFTMWYTLEPFSGLSGRFIFHDQDVNSRQHERVNMLGVQGRSSGPQNLLYMCRAFSCYTYSIWQKEDIFSFWSLCEVHNDFDLDFTQILRGICRSGRLK